ncbi:hypothetical protein AXF42_Ash004065 [Apostasia shenzhenica]|uniref:VQ domain-containing protein n=1 Tax=Apostasia shenzhenica TaxID=1088818 RepID=A0A2I0A1W1_9ASPA|nr:hypothetical protein AXF42_Ash004065 [Apostasia shenzhenica]
MEKSSQVTSITISSTSSSAPANSVAGGSFSPNPISAATDSGSTRSVYGSDSISVDNNSSSQITSSVRTLNKSSYKISKPIWRNPNPNPIRPTLSTQSPAFGDGGSDLHQQQHQSQPPVYNIDKSDFRDVVQKLTGSPAHLSNRLPATNEEHRPPQPPGHPSSSDTSGAAAIATSATARPPLSRLHRIRPPPLAPMPMAAPSAGDGWIRLPLSPLPPLPTVSAAAESPISAYMRRLHSGQPVFSPSSPGISAPPLLPLSPLGFGCVPSPRAAAPAYQVTISPVLLLPTSPGPPMPSPKWRGQ